MSEELLTEKQWQERLKKTMEVSDADIREQRTLRIMSDPRPEIAREEPKPYPTTEKHYIICVDEAAANESLPEAADMYGIPHKIGGILVSDRKEVPSGWIKTPAKGTPIAMVAEEYPQLFEVLSEKKVSHF